MSQHRSLKIHTWKSKRTVRKKGERFKTYYELLKKGGLSDEEIKIYGLPKEKIIVVKPTKPKKKEEEKTIENTLGFKLGSK